MQQGAVAQWLLLVIEGCVALLDCKAQYMNNQDKRQCLGNNIIITTNLVGWPELSSRQTQDEAKSNSYSQHATLTSVQGREQ